MKGTGGKGGGVHYLSTVFCFSLDESAILR